MKERLLFLSNLYRQTVEHLFKHNSGFMAAAVSYQTIFIISPLLFFLVNLLNLVFDNEQTKEFVLDQIAQFYGSASSDFVEVVLDNTRQWGDVSLVNLIFVLLFLFGLSGFAGQIRYSFNTLWEAKIEQDSWKGVVLAQLFNLTVVLGLILLLFVLVVSNFVLSNLFSTFPNNWIPAEVLNQLGFFLVFSALLFGLAKILIRQKIANLQLLIGVVHSSFLFTLGQIALTWYFSRSDLLSLYGASASLVVLLIWINFSATTIFFGLSLAKVLQPKAG